jgi:hypothetical protein
VAEKGDTESLQTASNAMNDVKPNSDSKQPQKEKLRYFFKGQSPTRISTNMNSAIKLSKLLYADDRQIYVRPLLTVGSFAGAVADIDGRRRRRAMDTV